jgi:hypothetical protein
MPQLLIAAPCPPEDQPATRFGGRPLIDTGAEFNWPRCADCSDAPHLQFLGQLATATAATAATADIISLFMCAAGDGCCTWEADGGANLAHIFSPNKTQLYEAPPTAENALRATTYGAIAHSSEAPSYDEARIQWAANNGGKQRQVLGQIGGTPQWLQADETPICDCGEPMAFVAQLEEGPDYATAFNFGSGCAYVFRCGTHNAKMLWQC